VAPASVPPNPKTGNDGNNAHPMTMMNMNMKNMQPMMGVRDRNNNRNNNGGPMRMMMTMKNQPDRSMGNGRALRGDPAAY
jgi:hypothetical protein